MRCGVWGAARHAHRWRVWRVALAHPQVSSRGVADTSGCVTHDAAHAHVAPRNGAVPLREWWRTHYGAALFTANNKAGAVCVPTQVDELLTLMHTLVEAVAGGAAREDVAMANEMRALLMYLAQHKLRAALAASSDQGVEGQSNGDKPSNTASDTARERAVTTTSSVLRRAPGERLGESVAPVSAAALARAEKLVQVIHHICAYAQPTRRVRSVLYDCALHALRACEQTTPRTLATLATCLARCVDRHAVTASHTDDDDDEDDVQRGVRYHVRPCGGGVSAAETAEARRGGCGALAVTPVTIIAHLHILTRALCTHLESAYASRESSGVRACGDDALAVRRQGATRGKLGLCSLQERKRRERSVTGTCAKATTVVLADVADACTAIASMHYGEPGFWNAVTRFTCEAVHHNAVACGDEVALRQVRDVAFALDYVGQTAHYDEVIAALLRHGLVHEPVPPPPSHTRHAMRQMTGKAA